MQNHLILNITIASARTHFLSFTLSLSNCLSLSIYLVSYAKKANAFLCWWCVCALDHGQIYRIYGSKRRHVTRLTQVGVSRESRDMSLSLSYPLSLSLSFCLGQKVARHMPRTRTVAQAWPGPARPKATHELEQVELVRNSIKVDSIKTNAFKLVSDDDDDICKNKTHLNNTSNMHIWRNYSPDSVSESRQLLYRVCRAQSVSDVEKF